MIEFPYGIADFRAIRQDGMVYVDRTAYIRTLEQLGRPLVFLRPRRFGKSLWIQTLASYYDLLRTDEFDELFGDLAIGADPTPRRNRYFVLQWNFSQVRTGGDVAEISRLLEEHVAEQARVFVRTYKDHLPFAVEVDGSSAAILGRLLAAVRETPFKLYLLVDEYDNFVNDVMVRDAKLYQALFGDDAADGPYKALFKSVKASMEGRGLERVFITGVSPIALNDLTSGFNVAVDISLKRQVAALCGFTQDDVRDLLERVAGDRRLPAEAMEHAAATMRTWYNGYRFTDMAPEAVEQKDDLVYNPTNSLYFLKELHQTGKPPEKLHDMNLRTDRGKLAFLAKTSAGSGVIEQLTEGDGTVGIARLEESFSLDELLTGVGVDRQLAASFLYYMGLLTLETADPRPCLRVPNLVVRKLLLDRLLGIYLPGQGDYRAAKESAAAFLDSGELAPLLAFLEATLLPILSNRDRGSAPRTAGASGGGVNEMVVKALFLSILFDDTRYAVFSELELDHRYADLCLLVRPEMRRYGYFDLLFEFKLVRRKTLGKTGPSLAEIDDAALRQLPAVAAAFAEARRQVSAYRAALVDRFGESALRPRSWVVVAVGLERLLGEEV